MKDLRFRTMVKADLPVITKIESDCQSHPWTLLQFLDGFNAGHEGWVACRDYENRELIVGFAVLSRVLDESTLLNICVRPAFQKQGYGRIILDNLLDQARSENIERIFLEVRVSNSSAIKLYESVGFEKIAERRDYYPAIIGREDGLVYSLKPMSDAS
jgi:[ribosomal protein S18]-alanine N-acetyltransferase